MRIADAEQSSASSVFGREVRIAAAVRNSPRSLLRREVRIAAAVQSSPGTVFRREVRIAVPQPLPNLGVQTAIKPMWQIIQIDEFDIFF